MKKLIITCALIFAVLPFFTQANQDSISPDKQPVDDTENASECLLKFTPQQIDFDQVALDDTAYRKMTVNAAKNHTVQILSIDFISDWFDGFAYESDCGKKEISDIETCYIQAQWNPVTVQKINSKFKITYQETNTSDARKQTTEVAIIGASISSDQTSIRSDKTVRLVYDANYIAIGYAKTDYNHSAAQNQNIYDFSGNIIGKADSNNNVIRQDGNIIGHLSDERRYLALDEKGNILGWIDENGRIVK